MKRSIFIYSLLLFLCLEANAFSRLLNFPRVGDKMTVCTLSENSVKTDSTFSFVDLKDMHIMANDPYSVWEPAPGLSNATMLVKVGREQNHLREDDDGLVCILNIKPGYVRYNVEPLPFIMDKSEKSNYPIWATGRVEGISDYNTLGSCSFSVSGDGSIYLSETDTLFYSERTERLLTESMYVGDSILHHNSILNEWYVPGNRYPIVSRQYDVLLTVSNDTIDTNTRWLFIDPAIQEEEVKDDRMNEVE